MITLERFLEKCVRGGCDRKDFTAWRERNGSEWSWMVWSTNCALPRGRGSDRGSGLSGVQDIVLLTQPCLPGLMLVW